MVETIVTALLGGLAAMTGKVASEAAKDAYKALKGLLLSKLGAESKAAKAVADLEEEPESEEQKIVVAERLKAAKAGEDPELLEAARRLQTVLNELPPEGRAHVQHAVGNYNALASGGSTAKVIIGAKQP